MSSATAFPLTSASGILGAALIPPLSRCHLIALSRHAPLSSADGLHPGDLTEHRPGLAPFRTRPVAAGHGPYGDNALAPADGGGQP